MHDWIAVAAGVLGWVSAYLRGRGRLPSWVRRWLFEIGQDTIVEAIAFAQQNLSTPEDRRKAAVEYLQRATEKRLGFKVPTSIANNLVEHVYQLYKRTRR